MVGLAVTFFSIWEGSGLEGDSPMTSAPAPDTDELRSILGAAP
jgi:hypothetical protein